MRKDLDAVLDRNAGFSDGAVKAGALLHIKSIGEIEPPLPKKLEDWHFPRDWRAYMAASVERFQRLWEARADVADDCIPYMAPYYGIAEHSSFVGGDVVYGGNTSYHVHPLSDWSRFDELRLTEDNENFRMLLDSMCTLKERAAEVGFLPSLRGVEAPMDMANAVRGNDLFYDLYDDAENVHRLCAFCLEAGLWTIGHQAAIVGTVRGCTLSGYGIMMPGRGIGHFSEDASCLCSAAQYGTFGLPYTRRLLEQYDCAQAHIHAAGRQVLPAVGTLEKCKFIEISRDPNQPAPISVLKEYERCFDGKIPIVTVTLEELEREREYLKGRKTILWLNCDTLAQAKRAVDLAHEINDELK